MGCLRSCNNSWRGKAFLLAVVIFLMLNSFLLVIMPSLYPYGYAHYLFGIPVELPYCKANSERYYLTLTTIVRNRAKYMSEWIEFHLMQGVQHVYLYDNNSTDNLQGALRPYIKANLLTIKPFPNRVLVLFDGTREILTQKLFLKDTIETHACETRWMAMLDSDEFILPASGENKSLQDILKGYEDYAALVMPWIYFTSNGWIIEPQNKLLIEAYTRRWKLPKHTWKQIIQPKRTSKVYSAHNFGSVFGYHAVNEKMVPFANWPSQCNGFMTRNVYTSEQYYSYDVIRLHHYKLRSAEDWERRKITGKVTGTNTGLGKRAMKKHWDEYFGLEAVESTVDNTTLKYVVPLREKLEKRFAYESREGMSYKVDEKLFQLTSKFE